MKICILGLNGFPDAFSAKVSRYVSITRMLASLGNTVLVVNREVGKTTANRMFDGGGVVCAVNSTGTDIRSYTLAKFLREGAPLWEFVKIGQFFKWRKVDVVIVYTSSFASVLIGFIVAKIYRAKLVVDYVEKRSQLQVRKGRPIQMLNDWFFERFAFRLFNGAFVISEYLKNEIEPFFTPEKVYKLPPICNFEGFRTNGTINVGGYFLYCGSVDYMDVVELIVESFRRERIGDKHQLFLVLSGNCSRLDELKGQLEDDASICFFSKLPYGELVRLYREALCLLIPMRPTIQDEARFPQKITEYMASGRPIISNPVGEIKHYFTHRETAILAEDYSVEAYSRTFRNIADGEFDLERIGQNSLRMGLESFDENAHSESLNRFLLSLTMKN